MTPNEILAIPAGRLLDGLVAQQVFAAPDIDWEEDEPFVRWHDDDDTVDLIPYYSRDIAAAWTVVEKLKQAGSSIYLWCGFSGVNSVWTAKIDQWGITSDSAPLAICLAALLVQTGQAS